MIKNLIVNTLSSKPLLTLGDSLFNHHVPVFMLHRMTCNELGVRGHCPELLRKSLAFLRKHKFNVVTIDAVVLAIKDQDTLPPRTIAFTLDDGYHDQVTIAADIFAEFDYPATFFVTTGFVEKDLWLWADKIQFLTESCNDIQLNKLIDNYSHLSITNRTKRGVIAALLKDAKRSSYSKILSKIEMVAQNISIEIPEQAPDKFQATSWNDLRKVEKRGMNVGAHTYCHPILSRETNEMSLSEMKRSKEDVSKNLKKPSNVFCYPVGRVQDYTKRETAYAKEIGFIGGTNSEPAAANLYDKEMLFSIPRFSFPDTQADFIQYATWIESLKERLRTDVKK